MLMRVPDERAISYTMTTVAVSILLSLIAVIILNTVTPSMTDYAARRAVAGGQTTLSVPGVGSVDLGKLDAASKRMEAEVAAARAGTAKAVPGAQLQAMLPGSIGGFARGSISSVSAGIDGLAGSNAEGIYTNAGKEFRLEVTDLGAMAGIATLGGALKVDAQRQNANGYEKAATVDGHLTTEKWNNDTGRGEYRVLVAGHFLVKASGAAPIEMLKLAVTSVDLARLESLAQR